MNASKHEDTLEGTFDRQYEKLHQLNVATALIKGTFTSLTLPFIA